MSKLVQAFAFEDHDVRVIMIDDLPWWVANDVCATLGIANPRDAIDRLDLGDVVQTDVIDNLGRAQQTNIINEPALYELIFRSDKPAARRFTRWVTSVVLPSIRKTGTFSVPTRSRSVALPENTSRGQLVLDILRMLGDGEKVRIGEIADVFPMVRPVTLRGCLCRMVGRGELDRVARGVYRISARCSKSPRISRQEIRGDFESSDGA